MLWAQATYGADNDIVGPSVGAIPDRRQHHLEYGTSAFAGVYQRLQRIEGPCPLLNECAAAKLYLDKPIFTTANLYNGIAFTPLLVAEMENLAPSRFGVNAKIPYIQRTMSTRPVTWRGFDPSLGGVSFG